MSDIEEMGPIDWLLIEFDGPLAASAAAPLLDLVDRGLIRLLDIMFLMKHEDGSVTAVEISELPGEEAVHVDVFVGASSGLLGEDDAVAATEAMEQSDRAIMIVYENRWAAPFAVAVREAGGQLVDQGRIPIQAILARLEELAAVEAS